MVQKDYIINLLDTPLGKIPVVPTSLNFKDQIGAFKVRINIGRMNYKVNPGLYAVGTPNENSPVLVSANYKLSFDYLRKELKEINAWILVLNTNGINVWCAAGKGTFGTDELERQINETGLEKLVTHRKIIVPQLGAPGIAAHNIQQNTGFKVIYGPVLAKHIPDFIKSGLKATDEMRLVKFGILHRISLIPVEISQGFKYIFLSIVIMFLLSGIYSKGFSIQLMLSNGIPAIFLILISFLSGLVLTPILLPYIPARAFALKGFIINLIIFATIFTCIPLLVVMPILAKIALFLMTSAIAAFYAMNYTGCSTFTSLSGVKKEMKIAVPFQIISLAIGLITWIATRFL